LLAAPLARAATAPYNANDPAQAAAYQRALNLGIQAYVYGIPLLDFNRVYRTSFPPPPELRSG
jgi:hypothetical protein